MDTSTIFGTGRLGQAKLKKATDAYNLFLSILGDNSKCSFEQFMEDQGHEGTYGCIQSPTISHFSYRAYISDLSRNERIGEALAYEAWKKLKN